MRCFQSSAPNAANTSGFTLVELILVLIVLGILSALAMPRFFDGAGFKERGFFDEVVSSVRYAQKLAVSSGCEVRVAVAGNAFELQQHQTDCTSGSFVTISGHPAESGSESGVTLTASPATFIFDAMGRASADVTVTVGSRSFNVVAETGYVQTP